MEWWKTSLSVSRQTLLIIYKLFSRPKLDYADIVAYNKTHKGSIIEKIEWVEYNVCLVITGFSKVKTRDQPYQEFD